MSKFSNILKMIILLKSRGKMKAKELSEVLEVDERQIRKYRDDLEMAGVHIESLRGIDGGYVIKGFDHLMNLDISEDELFALNLENTQLKDAGFIYYNELSFLIDKLNSLKKEYKTEENQIQYFVKSTPEINSDNERKKGLDINYSIITRSKIRIKYFSLSSGEKIRIIHPYAVISYKNSLYVVSYCENKKEIRDFKISRIREYEVLDDKFVFKKDFSLKNYMKNKFGIYRDGIMNVKLLIYKPMSYIVSEKVWVPDQKIIWNEDESIIFEAVMSGKTEIVSWILSMGSKVKVIEPQELKEEVKKEAEKLIKYY